MVTCGLDLPAFKNLEGLHIGKIFVYNKARTARPTKSLFS